MTNTQTVVFGAGAPNQGVGPRADLLGRGEGQSPSMTKITTSTHPFMRWALVQRHFELEHVALPFAVARQALQLGSGSWAVTLAHHKPRPRP